MKRLTLGLMALSLSCVSFGDIAAAQTVERDILCVKNIGKSNAQRDAYLAGSACRKGYERFDISKTEEFKKLTAQVGPQGAQGEKGEKGDQGAQGLQGLDGKDGSNGADGIDGKDGSNGVDGKDGTNGLDGKDGSNGIDGINGFDGADGLDGKDGIINVDSCYAWSESRTGSDEETQTTLCKDPANEFLLNSWHSVTHDNVHVKFTEPVFETNGGANVYPYPIGAKVSTRDQSILSPSYTLTVTVVCCSK